MVVSHLVLLCLCFCGPRSIFLRLTTSAYDCPLWSEAPTCATLRASDFGSTTSSNSGPLLWILVLLLLLCPASERRKIIFTASTIGSVEMKHGILRVWFRCNGLKIGETKSVCLTNGLFGHFTALLHRILPETYCSLPVLPAQRRQSHFNSIRRGTYQRQATHRRQKNRRLRFLFDYWLSAFLSCFFRP